MTVSSTFLGLDAFDWYVLAAILLLAVSSLLTRSLFVVFGDRFQLPARVRSALRYAPIAALTAIVLPGLLPWQAGAAPTVDYRLLAGTIAVLTYLRTRNTLLLIASGMLAIWVLRWLAG